jgi:hypothetical protein
MTITTLIALGILGTGLGTGCGALAGTLIAIGIMGITRGF